MRMRALYVTAMLFASSLAIGQVAPVPATSGGNPASIPVQPASDAGATERGLAPVQPGHPGVTRHVQNANAHDVDAQGHTLDTHGKPVGQAASPAVEPANTSTVH